MTRPERYAALVCVLCLIAAVLVGCATKPADDYPCEDEQGKRFDCSADEWMFQKLTKGSKQ